MLRHPRNIVKVGTREFQFLPTVLNLVEKLLVVSSRERGFGTQQGIRQDTDGPDIDGVRVGMV